MYLLTSSMRLLAEVGQVHFSGTHLKREKGNEIFRTKYHQNVSIINNLSKKFGLMYLAVSFISKGL